ncbi:MAG: hypothetical protein DRN29_05570 [Thermoplasmata archaeon]|nr:MAG: hypothetical protein DRN29_05570 [Thermoplasmata archaeon]HDN96172.1 hypothetical protein [Thermoplasmatales archaeon]
MNWSGWADGYYYTNPYNHILWAGTWYFIFIWWGNNGGVEGRGEYQPITSYLDYKLLFSLSVSM